MGMVLDLATARRIRDQAKKQGMRVVFTNGCFDILHRGHVEYLNEAKALGDILILGLNSDVSVRKIKGKGRPVQNDEDRATILSSLSSVDYVVMFHEKTPRRLIETLLPDVLVKGGNYSVEDVVGREAVWESGGEVVIVKEREGCSTSNLIEKIASLGSTSSAVTHDDPT